MSFIRTVQGDIPPGELGVCYAHEHIIIGPGYPTAADPDFLLDSVDVAVRELGDVHRAGGRAVIDTMPCDCGRDVRKLAEVSRRSGIHVVAPTGLHLGKYYDPGHWGNFYGEDELSGLFVGEITRGIDARDCGGPFSEITDHRAGLIKIATGESFAAREEKVFAAAAEAHRRTGVPILTHTEQGMLGLDQIGRLRDRGVDPGRVVLSHLDRRPDPGYHREVLSTGARVEYDSAFRWKPGQGNPTLDLIVGLIADFPDQIMLGMDAARRSYWRHYGGSPGLDFLLTKFTATLKSAGLTAEDLERVFIFSPAAAYAFTKPTAT